MQQTSAAFSPGSVILAALRKFHAPCHCECNIVQDPELRDACKKEVGSGRCLCECSAGFRVRVRAQSRLGTLNALRRWDLHPGCVIFYLNREQGVSVRTDVLLCSDPGLRDRQRLQRQRHAGQRPQRPLRDAGWASPHQDQPLRRRSRRALPRRLPLVLLCGVSCLAAPCSWATDPWDLSPWIAPGCMSTERGGGSCCLMSQRHCADSGGQGRPSRGKLYGAGGISNGEHIVLRIAFKPTSTIGKQQSTVNRSGEDISLRCPPWRAAHMVDSLVRPIFLFT